MLTPDRTGQDGCLEPATCAEVQIRRAPLPWYQPMRKACARNHGPVVPTYSVTRWPSRAYTWLANPAMPACEPRISQAVVPGLSFSWMTQRACIPSGPGNVAGPAAAGPAVVAPALTRAGGDDVAARG